MLTVRRPEAGFPADGEFWARIIDHATDSVIVYDSSLRYVALNRAAAAIYGVEPSALIGRTRDEVAGLDEVTPQLREVLRTMRPVTILNEVATPNGPRAYETVYQAVRDPLAGSPYVVGIARELTSARERTTRTSEKLRSLFENTSNQIVAIGLDGRITDANPAVVENGNVSRDELIGTHIERFVEASQRVAVRAMLARSLAGESLTFDLRLNGEHGIRGDFECTTSPILTDGESSGAFAVLKDITDRKRAERALNRQHERIRQLYMCAAAGNISAETQIQRTLELGCRLLGLDYGAIYDAQSEDGSIAFSAASKTAQEEANPIPPWLCKYVMTSSETVMHADARVTGPTDANGARAPIGSFVGIPIEVGGANFGSLNFASARPRRRRFQATDRDFVQLISVLVGAVLERRRARSHLRSLAYYDALTGLPNRVLLRERLHSALDAGLETGTKCAVLFLDLDHFKDINDTLGHALGDRLLQVAAERVVGCVRPTETVARMGGDEFIVVMPGVRDASEVTALAERLLRAVEGPFVIAGHEQYTTTSIGISISPADGRDAEMLIKHADIAMYRAKDRGRNCYELYRPELDVNMAIRISQETGLRKALERGEFRSFFQPLIDLSAKRIYGVEALARWQHSTLSLLRPDDFIATAEASGLIVKLGEFVLDDACRQLVAWREAGFGELRLSVNLSARQFRQPDLLQALTTILERTGFPPQLLDLEITESVAMSDAASNVEIMRQLKSAGTRVLLDDFGTGYSSLGYLRRFPLDGLKIDRTFTEGIGKEQDDETIVRAVVALAHSLGLEVVAEGVETQEQVDFLQREHCDRVQGNYYAPALPASGCERYMRAWAELRGNGSRPPALGESEAADR